MKKQWVFLLSIVFLLGALRPVNGEEGQAHNIVRRAAFDIGSGQIKVQVSDVDLTANKIQNILFIDTALVPLREDLSKSLDGRFSPQLRHRTVEAIKELVKKTAPFHPDAYHAIATESLRLAKDGAALAEQIEKETGVPVTIVSQQEEGILGFMSAVHETALDPDQAISWDFGGGSFQITTQCADHYCVYQGRLGRVPLKNALLKIQGKDAAQIFTPNPISKSHAEEAIQWIKEHIQDVPLALRQKLQRPDVVVLGIGINPLWGMPHSAHFDKTHVLAELESRLNLDDEAILIKDSIPRERKDTAAVYVTSNLILAYGVMEAFEMTHVRYVGTQGANAVGVLLSPHYWQKPL